MAKILIADSSQEESRCYARIASRLGFEADVCSNIADASRKLAAEPREVYGAALILWGMSGPPSGIDLVIQCRHQSNLVPVAVLSDSLDATLATRAFSLGAQEFLVKPVADEDLISCLWRLIGEPSPLPEMVHQMKERIRGESPALLKCLRLAADIIPHDDLRVLLLGESGTGKELLAREIHQRSSRSTAPWVAVSINETPRELVASALFGHEAGAFTGADKRRIGCFEEAQNGVLFLDEIGDLELPLQAQLLRVLQERKFRRIGGKEVMDFRARLVCATHRELAVDVENGRFRRDLFHRIAEATVHVPPLREREGDIGFLTEVFLEDARTPEGGPVSIARETRAILETYRFPGNVRELAYLVRSAAAKCGYRGVILPFDLPLAEMAVFMGQTSDIDTQKGKTGITWPEEWLDMPLREATREVTQSFDRVYLPRLLEQYGNNLSKAAEAAEVDRKTFRTRLSECQVHDDVASRSKES